VQLEGRHRRRGTPAVRTQKVKRFRFVALPEFIRTIQDASGKLAHSIVQPDGWRIRHTVAAAAGGPTRTGTNPAGLVFSARRRPSIVTLM
jgi:hypothetical protein